MTGPQLSVRRPVKSSFDRPVVWWLLTVAALVFVIVVVGGVTRLTRSGLSIVEWNPVIGAIPPLSERQWLAEFEKYQQTPEYRTVNAGMPLDAFKRIYYVEWAHRLLGRLIGIAFAVPLAYFALRRRISWPLMRRLSTILVLGGLQGALGWFMVKSGLVDIPRVSPYRLTAHLGLAVAIYGYLVWIALDLNSPSTRPPSAANASWTGILVTALVFVMILAGGFVAGTRAGFAFNTFPLMNDRFVPDGLYVLSPWWTNLFENVATVQFDHRVLAYTLVLATLFYWWLVRRSAPTAAMRRGVDCLLAAIIAQSVIGVATLLLVVPIALAALHQAGALIVFTTALYLNHAICRRA